MALKARIPAGLRTCRMPMTICLCLLIPVWFGIGSPLLGATTVIMETSLGSFEVELFDEVAPNTVANFLKYVGDGDYQNSFIHRSVPGFVIQGGGYIHRGTANTFLNNLGIVPTDAPVVNEFHRSNTRGTIAMAKIGGDPNSATSQWFINLADNSASLDSDNGGYTVFGVVSGNGMSVVDEIASQVVWNAGNPLNGVFLYELPLINFPGGFIDDIKSEHLVIVNIRIDTDTDDDGIVNQEDNCPSLPNPDQGNHDTDNQGDSCDEDDDNDGLADTIETEKNTNPWVADTDGDGMNDGLEVGGGRNPLVNESAVLLLLLSEP